MTALLDAWRAHGRRVEVDGLGVFVIDRGPSSSPSSSSSSSSDAPPAIVVLHGFPSWSGDYALVIDALAARHRVVLHDHIGFGLSEKPAPAHIDTGVFGYSLMEQADIAVNLWRALGLTRVHILAHDYGTSVTTEILARRQRRLLPAELQIESVTLSNGSVHLELAQLLLAQRLLRSKRAGPLYARLASRSLFVRNLRRTLRRPVDDAHLLGMWAALEHDGGTKNLPAIGRYLLDRERFQPRWVSALQKLDVPAHVLWADDDPIAVRAIGEALAGEIPGARHTRLPGTGHYPMLEDPTRWAAAALDFLDALAP